MIYKMRGHTNENYNTNMINKMLEHTARASQSKVWPGDVVSGIYDLRCHARMVIGMLLLAQALEQQSWIEASVTGNTSDVSRSVHRHACGHVCGHVCVDMGYECTCLKSPAHQWVLWPARMYAPRTWGHLQRYV